MSYMPANRSFRFEFDNVKYAVDVQVDGIAYFDPAVHLFYMTGNGWFRAHAEMEPLMIVDQAAIDAAGGIVKLCKLIVAKLNKALAILHGKSGEVEVPPGTVPHEAVADYLRTHLSLTVSNGVPVLVLAD